MSEQHNQLAHNTRSLPPKVPSSLTVQYNPVRRQFSTYQMVDNTCDIRSVEPETDEVGR